MYTVDGNASLGLPFPDMTYTSRVGPIPKLPAFWSLSQPHQNNNHRYYPQRGPSKTIYCMETIVVGGQRDTAYRGAAQPVVSSPSW